MTTPTRRLDATAIQTRLQDITTWAEVGGMLQRTFVFDDFASSIAFVRRVAELAEKAVHHPDILIRYCHVTLSLSTHDVDGISEKDFSLAVQVNEVA